jgi:hypothetical protein
MSEVERPPIVAAPVLQKLLNPRRRREDKRPVNIPARRIEKGNEKRSNDKEKNRRC